MLNTLQGTQELNNQLVHGLQHDTRIVDNQDGTWTFLPDGANSETGSITGTPHNIWYAIEYLLRRLETMGISYTISTMLKPVSQSGGFTQLQLQVMFNRFNLLDNNWKGRLALIVRAPDVSLAQHALIHFVGGYEEFVGRGFAPGMKKITSKGYYHYIGA